ncbi:uncharacterized protein LOC131626522 [Vicia villosa]|uniref:uncharacterized protein LOC131626522 n=1 Tax=Vicia villosa TaxID=3911 RepID=UPI00273B5645|nr:uncharacterized protein LOC131626522 [Vicia villosa]
MDRSWMRANRLSDEYEHGVMEFLEFAESNAKKDLHPPKSNAEDSHPTLFLCPCHGEVVANSNVSQKDNVSVEMDDRLKDMMCEIEQDSFKRARAYDSLCNDKDTPLYPGCTNFTRLSAVLKLFNRKAINGWTDKSFAELLQLLTQMLPEGNILPSRYYEAKKILCPMGLEYEKIHACPNDCILYRKEFKRLFANANDAKNLRWHAEERKCDGQIRHAADSLQWKKIDYLFPNFGKQSRNLRLGLATDGMNPFGNLNTNHSSWPVLLMIYNLSPRLSMKRKYIMLSMMISGPKQPENDIDVYLSPLIDDLKVLWEEGVDVFDAHSGEQFNMCAMLFCTINDFPAYGNLSGYKVKGHKACPICEKDTCYHQLEKGKKTVYLGHRKFLNRYHPYRRLRTTFNGEQEHGVAPKPLTGEEVYQRQQDITAVFGKYQKRPIVKNIWQRGNKTYLPPACYTLSKKEKISFCECLESIKVSHGYSSNVKRLVSVKDLKLVGLKSHDCHVLMQQLLPVAIRGILPKNVRKTITRLCLFFNAICFKSIDPLKLEDLENEAAVTLCQLEMFFPPSFFDIMVHLIVHLVREIRLYGPIFLRWMYPIERYMKILKGYTKKPRRPEASIIERYIAEEAIEFCSNYLSEVNAVGVPKSRHDGRCEGVGTQGLKIKSLSIDVVVQAHLYILNNTDEVQPYLSAHKSIIKKKYPKMSERGLLK